MNNQRRNFITWSATLTTAAIVTLGACAESATVRAGGPVTPPPSGSVAGSVAPQPSGTPSSAPERTQVSAPSAVTPPPSGAPNPGQERTAPQVEKPTNRNVRDTPTSRLCWAQREAVLLVVNAMMASDAKGVVTAQLVPTLDIIETEIVGLQSSKVDPALAPFVQRFATDLKAARTAWTSVSSLSSQDVVNSFDFESYPGVTEFAAAAKRDPGCVDIV
jgi:hypothetical protein